MAPRFASTVLTLLCCLGSASRNPTAVFSAFRDAEWGVRPESMGGAFVAIANDANTVAYNPAGTVNAEKAQIAMAYTKPFSGFGGHVNLGQFYLSYVRPLKPYFGFGLAWTNLSSPELKENGFTLNAATNLEMISPELGKRIGLGLNLKWMNRSFQLDERTVSDPVFRSGDSASALGIDFGLWALPSPQFAPGLSVGLMLKNFNQPDLGLDSEDKVPLEVVPGLALQTPLALLTFDYSRRAGRNTFRGGLERSFFKERVAVRMGANSAAGSFGFGYRQPLNRFRFFVDYAFILPFYVQESAGTHRVSIALLH